MMCTAAFSGSGPGESEPLAPTPCALRGRCQCHCRGCLVIGAWAPGRFLQCSVASIVALAQ
eukprot:9822397-Alexandrium_andersonii.AAC.1